MNLESIFRNLSLIWTHLEWYDFLDIVLVWVVVYKVLTFIRGTGAVQILAGLGIVTIAYIFSIWLELTTLNWALHQFFNNLFLIVIILFQGDIRRALAHIGRNPFFSGISETQEVEAIEELCQGAFVLAKKGYGALIVLEREIGLIDYVEKGVALDSEIHCSLLISIFQPLSPLHDGAIIIRGGRITSAGTFLPLSRNPNIDHQYGTRHRAGIGISEETDALVIIVSEEKKQVAIAEQGIITIVEDFTNLRAKLLKAFEVSPINIEVSSG